MQDRLAAPEGYSTNEEAILDLIRYGFGIWTPKEMAVLLYHAERTTARGLVTHEVTKGQAVKGWKLNGKWARGPVGVHEMAWNAIHKKLSESGGPLRIFRFPNPSLPGENLTPQYSIHWPSIRRAINAFKTGAPVTPPWLQPKSNGSNVEPDATV